MKKLFTLSTALLGLLLISCSGGRGLAPRGAEIPNPIPAYNPLAGVSNNCPVSNPLNVTLTPSQLAVGAGEKVAWIVNATGCTGTYRLVGSGLPTTNFNGATMFEKIYGAGPTATESFAVISVDSSGVERARRTVSGTVTVNPGLTSLRCTIDFRSPSIVSATMDSNYNFTSGLPNFDITVQTVETGFPTASARVTEVRALLGEATSIPGVSQLPISNSIQSRILVNSAGPNYLFVKVISTNTNVATGCWAPIDVRTGQQAPSPVVYDPQVDITANRSDGPISVAAGTRVKLHWSSIYALTCTVSDGTKTLSTLTSNVFEGIDSDPMPATGSVTFTLTCLNSAGKNASNSVVVNVATPTDHVMFLSSSQQPGNLGGFAGADQICTDLARAAGNTPTVQAYAARPWKALLAATGSPISTRITLYGTKQVKNANGVLLFTSFDITPAVLNPKPVHNEKGVDIGDEDDTWTGANNFTTANGNHCQGVNGPWTSADGDDRGRLGASADTTGEGEWLSDTVGGSAGEDCDVPLRLYCISQ